ncbi:MAG: CpsB/CapC family capsule biosynthesis tyrosine phosphatase [Eubacteriales bacterium]|jgi:protein-tyrosine phosphatase
MFIDFHAHILPECDHGSNSLENSLYQLSEAQQAGVSTVVATPHFYMYHDTVDSFIDRRDHCYQTLIEATNLVNLNINIIKAAEVTLFIDLPNLTDLRRLCIEGTNYMLLEIPGQKWSNWVSQSLSKLIYRHKIIPVIAHIDRYDTRTVRRLAEMKIPFQLNASALIPVIRRLKYMKMIEHGRIHVLGSDVHSTAKEYKDFARAVKVLNKHIDTLNKNASIILHGERLINHCDELLVPIISALGSSDLTVP